MKKAKKTLKTKEEGITLIALVVTIIVLLILAGISIAMLTGENGILNRAKEANEKTEIATEKEQRQLAMYEASMNLSGMTFQGVEIPAGFAPTRIAGESTVDEGLVIIDSEGNEFVWIPCTKEQYHSVESAIMSENWHCNNEYKDNGDTSGNSGDGKGNGLGWKNYYTAEALVKLNELYTNDNKLSIDKWQNQNQSQIAEESLQKYKGFYVARYEAGIPTNAPFYCSNNDLNYYNVNKKNIDKIFGKDSENVRGSCIDTQYIKNLKPLSQKGVQAWNYITQPNSKLIAENMYSESNSVGSFLIDSQAWNHICKNIYQNKLHIEIENSENYGNYCNNKVLNYTQVEGLWANHTKTGNAKKYQNGYVIMNTSENRIELSTGFNENFKIFNIYDMAGNLCEWTTECIFKNELVYVVNRGGHFENQGDLVPITNAAAQDCIDSWSRCNGFRVVLYLK